jgi:hypothetical protein
MNSKGMLIYNLQDLSYPIIRIEDKFLEDALIGFCTKKSDNQYFFTFYGEYFAWEYSYFQR